MYLMHTHTTEDITVKNIASAIARMCWQYDQLLKSIARCTREDSLMKRYQAINEIEDTTMMLIAYAKKIARTSTEQHTINCMVKRYNRVMCDRRDAIINN